MSSTDKRLLVELNDEQLDAVGGGVSVLVPAPAAEKNPNGRAAVGAPGSDEFVAFVREQPVGLGNLDAPGRQHNSPGGS